jgi:hypothetical protein
MKTLNLIAFIVLLSLMSSFSSTVIKKFHVRNRPGLQDGGNVSYRYWSDADSSFSINDINTGELIVDEEWCAKWAFQGWDNKPYNCRMVKTYWTNKSFCGCDIVPMDDRTCKKYDSCKQCCEEAENQSHWDCCNHFHNKPCQNDAGKRAIVKEIYGKLKCRYR